MVKTIALCLCAVAVCVAIVGCGEKPTTATKVNVSAKDWMEVTAPYDIRMVYRSGQDMLTEQCVRAITCVFTLTNGNTVTTVISKEPMIVPGSQVQPDDVACPEGHTCEWEAWDVTANKNLVRP